MYRLSEKILIDENTIIDKVTELSKKIDEDYKEDDNLLLICILKGAYIFLSDLSRAISVDHSIDFMTISSYGSDTKPKELRIRKDIDTTIKGRHVIVVEDIIDSGQTILRVIEMLKLREPDSIEICSLLNKPDRRTVDLNIKYKGFDIPDKFVVGYGMDYNEQYRNLGYIGYLEEEND